MRVTEGAMPRLARLDAPGVIHHIFIRGIERRKIFRDNCDQENSLERLRTLLLETKTGDAMPGPFFRVMPTFFCVPAKFRWHCHEEIADRVCGQFQPSSQAPGTSASKAV